MGSKKNGVAKVAKAGPAKVMAEEPKAEAEADVTQGPKLNKNGVPRKARTSIEDVKLAAMADPASILGLEALQLMVREGTAKDKLLAACSDPKSPLTGRERAALSGAVAMAEAYTHKFEYAGMLEAAEAFAVAKRRLAEVEGDFWSPKP
jgi:hypothetical protein